MRKAQGFWRELPLNRPILGRPQSPSDAFLFQPIFEGLHRWPFSIATRPHPSHTYCMAASLSLHTWVALTSGAPQKLHLDLSPQGLQRCPGSSATAPQFLQVYAIIRTSFLRTVVTTELKTPINICSQLSPEINYLPGIVKSGKNAVGRLISMRS